MIQNSDIGAKFDLTLYLSERNGTIYLNLVYNADLFHAERMRELLAQYELLLEQIVNNPDQNIASYSLLTDQAKNILPNPSQELSSFWRHGIYETFTQQAQCLPEKVALSDAYGSWTYQQLDATSNQLANYLRANGISSQDVVAVYADRSASLVCALLGILKAGAAFLILDPAYPPGRLIDYLRLAQPKAWLQLESAGTLQVSLQEFLTTSSCSSQFVLPATPSQATNSLSQFTNESPVITVGPDDLAYIAFTSGSTGQPKGILGTHQPLAHFIHWHTHTFGLQEADRFSLLSGLAHDPLLRDIFTPLCLGATLCIPKQEQILSPGELLEWMTEQHISIAHLTPALEQVLATTSAKLSDLRYAFFGGEALSKQHILSLTRLAPNVTCVNFYGATETPQAMSYSVIDLSQSGNVIPLGQGIEDVQLLVLNAARQQAGIGEVGEVFIRTPYLSRGYLRDAELTQQRFLINPFTNDPSDRIYKTGDLGRYLRNGEVEFLGRNDNQVKIRGFRIELGEIERVLNSHPAIRQVVVSVWETEPDEKRLVAYIVSDFPQPFQSNELRNFLQAQLPDYMIPATFISLDTLPLTPNGKLDRRSLPLPGHNDLEAEYGDTTARNATEEKLVKIWQDILHVRSIGVRDSFFELGGHSLMAVHLFNQINREFNLNLPLATLFQDATIEHIASVIDSKAVPVTWSSLIEIEPQGNHPPFFCVHGITGDILWFRDLAQCLAPDYPFYGLQARGLDGIQDPIPQIEAMAAHYIEEIRSLQPNGPYLLGGASFGGTVALEIAQQLVQQGAEVSLLAIFDHAPHNVRIEVPYGKFKKRLIFTYKVIKNFPFWFKEFLQVGPSRMWTRFRRKWRSAQKVRQRPELNNLEHFDPADFIDFASELSSRRLELIATHYRAMKTYNPKPYPGRVTLLRAKSRPLLNTFDPATSWEKLAPGRVEVKDIPSSHEGMFRKPNVYHLAECLKDCIDKVSDQKRQPQDKMVNKILSLGLMLLLSSTLLELALMLMAV